jgi:hypothetical protein
MLTWMLGRPFDTTVVTPGLVAAATQNARHGGDFIDYLQSRYPDQTRAAVNEQVLLAAASSRPISFLGVLEKRYSITVTEEHKSIARLRHAALTNDLKTVEDLLSTGIHPDYPDGAGRTPLRLASKRGYLEVVQELIRTGRVDVNTQDDLGQTPLLVAVLHEHHDLIYPLMVAGADPNLKDSCRDTAYSVAEKAGDYISLRRLREAVELRAVRVLRNEHVTFRQLRLASWSHSSLVSQYLSHKVLSSMILIWYSSSAMAHGEQDIDNRVRMP